MFGKRPDADGVTEPRRLAPTPAAGIATRPRSAPAPGAAPASGSSTQRVPTASAPAAPGAPTGAAVATANIVREQSDYYHATKTAIFNALLNTIDLSQLAQLDTKQAGEEIRDIVAELVAIKNVSMSAGEQDHLIQDIINDVLGYGPLEPLLARDDIADIMVNGAQRVFIEVNGKVQLTNVRFRDNMQLMNICQRIVSQV
ncbi:MAG: cpaF, partial [Caulobacteraceae bacterium]|nr:cpaF [Caulobacteraceae bacterium]